MSVYKVERRVDTVFIEMSSTNAEALLEVLNGVEDLTSYQSVQQIASALNDSGEIRTPSPLFHFDPYGATVRFTTAEETRAAKLEAQL